MNEIVMYFNEISTKAFEEICKNFLDKPQNFAEACDGISKELNNLGKKVIVEMLENMDKVIQASPARKHDFIIERHDSKKFETRFGEITYSKTLFENKQTKEQLYLLDYLMGLDKNERIAEDVKANMLEEAVSTSYKKAGRACCPDTLTKQTTKNLIHDLDFPALNTRAKTKRKVETLYIEADEDHIHLQFKEDKGDIKRNRFGRKKNGLITKLIYVHEGLRKVAPASSRKELINPAYFANCCHGGKENEEFWDEVYEYIESMYDLKYVKNIYFSSDGGKWIQAGVNRLGNVTYVLDEFHLNKYLHKIAGKFPKDSNLIFNYLKYCIAENDKELFKQSIVDLKSKLKKDGGIKEISVSCAYVLSNWDAARRRIIMKNKIFGCSAEGHVSHVLSDRMSSRPMGWSRKGADKMAKLRAYKYNNKSMLELVRYQKTKVIKFDPMRYYSPTKARSKILNSSEDMTSKYLDAFSHSTWPAKTHPLWLDRHIFSDAVGW